MDGASNPEEAVKTNSVPPPPEDGNELSALGRLSGKLKGKLEEAIERQFSLEGEKKAQASHMSRVAENVKSILAGEAKIREITLLPETESIVDAFAWGHDAGKFLKSETVKMTDELGESGVSEILERMGLTSEEKEIFGKAIDKQREEEANIKKGMSPSYVRQWDIAHNLLSAFYLESTDFMGEGANLRPETTKLLTDMVIAHQFSGYYQDVARGLGWEERDVQAINAVIRFQNSDLNSYMKLMIEAGKAGDLEEMLIIGEVRDGEFVPAGVTKIFLINIDLFLSKLGEENKSTDPSYCFDRTRRSIGQVAQDLKRLHIHALDGRIKEWVEGQRGTNNFLNALSASQVTLPNTDKTVSIQEVIEENIVREEKKKDTSWTCDRICRKLGQMSPAPLGTVL